MIQYGALIQGLIPFAFYAYAYPKIREHAKPYLMLMLDSAMVISWLIALMICLFVVLYLEEDLPAFCSRMVASAFKVFNHVKGMTKEDIDKAIAMMRLVQQAIEKL